MTRRSFARGIVVAAALAALSLSTTHAADEADDLIPGKIHIIKTGKLAKLVAKPVIAFNLPNNTNEPTAEGGSLQIFDIGTTGGNNTYALPSTGWKGLGNPAGSKGFKYKGAGTAGDPCKVVLVKTTVIKAVCKGSDVTLNPPFAGNSGIVLSLGTDTKRYCAEFGGQAVKNDPGLLKKKNANAPGACPSASTSTSTVPTTSTSTTSTTLPVGSCCNAESFVAFQVGIGAGDCGDITQVTGAPLGEVACGGLYFGGGGNSVPLPAQVPDTGQYVTKITGCTGGEGAVIAAATVLDTGSVENCTETGCFFGAPLPIPNTGSTPTSTCVVNNVAVDAAGTVDCSAGTANLSMPLLSSIYLTGDTGGDPTDTIPGIQPCPLCVGGDPMIPLSGTCEGGISNGMMCTPDTSDLGDAYPTSYDCLPDPMDFIGTLPIDYTITTGTVTYEAVPSGSQSRVFCGFCRDADITTNFQNPANKCFENGMAVGAGCSGTFESCEQRTQGAFGPGGGGVKTITVNGSSAGSLLDSAPHASTLVGIFCIPPTFNATVDAAGDLPGPGAAALQGSAELRTVP